MYWSHARRCRSFAAVARRDGAKEWAVLLSSVIPIVVPIIIDPIAYDQRRGRLEIEFTWTDDVRQFYPVAPSVYRQLLAAKPMYLFLRRLLTSRSIREERVRTESGRVLMMARELEKLLPA